MSAPRVIGGDGLPVAGGFGLKSLAEAPRFTLLSSEAVGEDRLETYGRPT